MGDGYPYWRMGIIVILIILNAAVSAAHTAFTSVNESQIRKRLEGNEDNSSNFPISWNIAAARSKSRFNIGYCVV